MPEGRRTRNSEKLPPNVSAFTDRHGKRRYRFRKTGMKAYMFKAHPGTPKHPSPEYKRLLSHEAISDWDCVLQENVEIDCAPGALTAGAKT